MDKPAELLPENRLRRPAKGTHLLRAALCAVVLFLATGAQSQNDSSEIARAVAGADRIAAPNLRSDLDFITADELHGRATPSSGLDLTAKFIVNRLSRAGLAPAGENGTWLQPIALNEDRLISDETAVEVSGRTFHYGEGFLLRSPFDAVASGGLVYAGDGYVLKGINQNPYEKLDVRGKFVIAVQHEPDHSLFTGKYGEDWIKPQDAAAKYGAKGIVYEGAGFRGAAGRLAPASITVAGASADQASRSLWIEASPALLEALLAGEKSTAQEVLDAAKSGRPLEAFQLDPKKELKITVKLSHRRLQTSNIIAAVEGADPKLKTEYVVVGAHYDTLPPLGTPGNEVMPGADDDGSGTVGLLAIAEAMAMAPRSKRSILFIWHTGEEELGWGSQYFTEHPTVPLAKIVAYINLDMIGRTRQTGTGPSKPPSALTGPDEVELMSSTSLGTEVVDTADRLNAAYLKLQLLHKKSAENSDHVFYERKGIPVLFFTTGNHSDIHRASDTAEKIDYHKLEEVARTAYATARALANR